MRFLHRSIFILAALGTACSSQPQRPQHPAAAPSLRNPLDFPLYAGSKIVSSRSFTQTINAQSGASAQSIFSEGNGTYTGHEVIAATGAPFTELKAWVARLNANPPAGYSLLGDGSFQNVHARAQGYGFDYASFERPQNGKTRGVLVIVMDPQRVNRRLGVVLSLMGKYKALPGALRAPVDDQVKARLGMSVSEALQPDSPVGATLGALDQFGRRDARGVVVLSAVKE